MRRQAEKLTAQSVALRLELGEILLLKRIGGFVNGRLDKLSGAAGYLLNLRVSIKQLTGTEVHLSDVAVLV